MAVLIAGLRIEILRTVNTSVANAPEDCIYPGDELAASLVNMMPNDGREHLVALALDTHGKPLAWNVVSSGTVDSVMLNPRDVFSFALTVPRVRFVGIAHNHPSGDVTPSDPDKGGTANMIRAGKILGLDLMWSLVVTHQSKEWALITPDAQQYQQQSGGGDDQQPQGQQPNNAPGDEPEPEEGDPVDEPEQAAAPAPGGGGFQPSGQDVSTDELRKLLKKAIGK